MRPISIAFFAVIASSSIVHAEESLTDLMAKRHPAFKAEVHMACGKLDKSNCAQVIPDINSQTGSSGLVVKPGESNGSLLSAQALCAGLVQTAVGQRDAFLVAQRQPDCAGKFKVLGEPLYPYLGYFVVRADAPSAKVGDMINATPEGKSLKVAVGRDGSGGQVTMAAMLFANPQFKRAITTTDYDQDTALQYVLDGTINGYFVMDSPGSGLIETIRRNVNKDGRPNFKFLELMPGDDFMNTKMDGKYVYQDAKIAGGANDGMFTSTHTISTDAVVIADETWRQSDSGKPSAALAKALDNAQSSIFADTHTPKDWRPASARQ